MTETTTSSKKAHDDDVDDDTTTHDNNPNDDTNNTSSHNDDDDDETSYTTGSDDEDDDDDDDDDSTSSFASFKEILVSAWKQHLVAILIAIVATGTAMYVQKQQQQQQLQDQHQHEQFQEYMSYIDQRHKDVHIATTGQKKDYLSSISNWKHEHLQGYQRTANISFCGTLKPQHERPDYKLMDFHVQQEHVNAMKLHYIADALEDDDYSLTTSEDQTAANAVRHVELSCLKQLAQPLQQQETSDNNMPPKTFVKGLTYYYQPPAFVNMFPNYEPPPGSTSSKKQIQPAHLSFQGFAAKFINLSAKPILLHWEGRNASPKLVGEIGPMESLGTATTPGQSFFVTPVYDSSHALDRWVLTKDDPVMVYDDDSYSVVPGRSNSLTPKQKGLYEMHQLNLEFAKHYLIASKRTWLGQFPRPFPLHFMHPAKYVGQQIPVTFEEEDGKKKKKKRSLVVESVTPRVLSMDNFLSPQECQELIRMATEQGLQGSTLVTTTSSSSSSDTTSNRDLLTRSSTNTWLDRDNSTMTNYKMNTDKIYRRAAQLLNIDEALLWQNNNHHAPDDPTKHSISESIQVVNYQVGEEYTAHHDFTYPSSSHRYQPTRFATLLMYLNDDGLKGGETNFPRAVNPSKAEGLTVKPKQGRAVLFYNMLPDGNHDDLSQHASFPVKKGEKWLANLWIWDPVIN